MSQGILEYELNKPVPYTLDVDEALLKSTEQKLQLARYPEEQTDVNEDDWSQGAKVDVVKRLAIYWEADYDWRAEEVPPASHSFLSKPPALTPFIYRRPRSMTSFDNTWSR